MSTRKNVTKKQVEEGKKRFGVYVGRFSPMHLGHEAQIKRLIEEFGEDHLVCIGSAGHVMTPRHMLKLSDRVKIMQLVFKKLRIAPLPDFGTDEEWLFALQTLIRLAGGDPMHATFIGGCKQDVSFFETAGYHVVLYNRFDGVSSPPTSATEVRDALDEGRSIDHLVNPLTAQFIREIYAIRKAEHKRM